MIGGKINVLKKPDVLLDSPSGKHQARRIEDCASHLYFIALPRHGVLAMGNDYMMHYQTLDVILLLEVA